MRSRQLWEKFAEDIEHQGVDPQEVLGWKKTGTLYILWCYCMYIEFIKTFVYQSYFILEEKCT